MGFFLAQPRLKPSSRSAQKLPHRLHTCRETPNWTSVSVAVGDESQTQVLLLKMSYRRVRTAGQLGVRPQSTTTFCFAGAPPFRQITNPFESFFGGAIAGYWAYGHTVNDNILFSLDHPRGVIALASMMVLIHVMGSYQVYSMPVRLSGSNFFHFQSKCRSFRLTAHMPEQKGRQ